MNTVQNTLIKELEKQGIKVNPTSKHYKVETSLHFSSFTELALIHDSLSILIGECGNTLANGILIEPNHIGNAIMYVSELQQKLNIFQITDTLDELIKAK